MTFLRPSLLWLVPAVTVVVALAEARRLGALMRLLDALGAAPPRWREARFRAACMVGAAALLSVGPAGPVRGWVADGEALRPPVVFALDVSASMAAEDGPGRRFDLVRAAALRALEALPPGPVGLTAFGDEAVALVPPTADAGLVRDYLREAEPSTGPGAGTDLAKALSAASAGLPSGSAVVLLTDGEGFEDDAALDEAGRAARARGVLVYAVVAGSRSGAPVPGVPDAVTRARPERAGRLAAAGGGIAVAAATPDPLIDRLARTPREADDAARIPVDGAPLAAAGALVLLLLEAVGIPARRVA